MTTRIYLVTSADNTERHLVRAALPMQAVRHISQQRYTAKVPTQDELLQLAGSGVTVQTAADDAGASAGN